MSTLLPSSSVNTMSSNDDKCFQCQESGHMACYCPCIRCFDCNYYGHVAVDCLGKILPSGIPARHRDNNSHMRWHDRSASWNNHCNRHRHWDHQDRYRFSRSQPHSHKHRYRSDSHSDSWRSCSRSYHWPTCCSTSCHRSSSTYHYHQDTPHSRSSSCRSFSRDSSTSRLQTSHKHHHRTSTGPSSSSNQTTWKTKDRKHKQVTFDDPPSEYYSSDEKSQWLRRWFKLEEPSPSTSFPKWGGLPKKTLVLLPT